MGTNQPALFVPWGYQPGLIPRRGHRPAPRLFFADHVAALFRSAVQEPGDPERGGIMCGYLDVTGSAEVVHLTFPMPGDVQRSDTWERRDPEHVEAIQRLHASSGGRLSYLGEWHTHPEDLPEPSQFDLDMSVAQHEIVAPSRPPGLPLYFLIVGRLGLRVWEVS